MSKIFITFGGGSKNFIEAGERLLEQVKELGLYDDVILFTDKDLKEDDNFWKEHSNFIENNKRGYGYWIWKPYIIKKTIDKMNDGDILLYLDSGFEINPSEETKQKNIELFEVVKKDYIIGSIGRKHWTERKYTKMDLILELDMNDDKYLNSEQRQGGINMFYICDKTREFINEWYNIACNYHFIDDSKSINKNSDDFIEHRHDQSIFSLLSKKYDLYSNENLGTITAGIRNRSGKSGINYNKEGFSGNQKIEETNFSKNNKCMLFNSIELSERIQDNQINKYNSIQTYILTKNFLDLDRIDNNYDNYFTTIPNNEYVPKNKIKTIFVDNKNKCMEECFNQSPNCKSITYMEKKKNNNLLNSEKKKIDSNNRYTDCINHTKIDDYSILKQKYTDECKKKYGDEYIYDDNIFDSNSFIKCDNSNSKKVKCKLGFQGIEYFTDYSSGYKHNFILLYVVVIFILMMIVSFYFIKGV